MDCSLPETSVHVISQARILEWVSISFFRGSSWPGDRIWISHIAGRHFTFWATRESSSHYWWNLEQFFSCFVPSITSTASTSFPGGTVLKNPPANAGDASLIPGLGRPPGVGNGNLLFCSCLENPMDRGASGLQSMGSQRVRHGWAHMRVHKHTSTSQSDVLTWQMPGELVVFFTCWS